VFLRKERDSGLMNDDLRDELALIFMSTGLKLKYVSWAVAREASYLKKLRSSYLNGTYKKRGVTGPRDWSK
jgi:phosphopantetheine adenylyltransferase